MVDKCGTGSYSAATVNSKLNDSTAEPLAPLKLSAVTDRYRFLKFATFWSQSQIASPQNHGYPQYKVARLKRDRLSCFLDIISRKTARI